MCGISGIAGALGFRDDKTMQRMLMLNIFRGIHSTGLAAIRANGDSFIAKTASHPIDLFESPRFKTALNGNDSQLFIGHNRHATRGEISSYNAHPFDFPTLVGCHNGTLETRCKKRLEKELGLEFGTDSEALFAAIDKFGLKDAMSLVEEGTHQDAGAWSLVWYDKTDHTLNMLRNKWRPMWYAYTQDFKRMFFGSRWEDVNAAIELSEVGYDPLYVQEKDSKGEDVCWKFFTTASDTHYVWDLQALKEGAETRPKPRATFIKYHAPWTRPTQSEGNVTAAPFGERKNPTGFTIGPPSTRTPTGGKKDGAKKLQVINLIGDRNNPFAGIMEGSALSALVEHGCTWCEKPLDLSKSGHYLNIRTNVILCPKCAGVKGHTDANRVYMPPAQFCEIAK